MPIQVIMSTASQSLRLNGDGKDRLAVDHHEGENAGELMARIGLESGKVEVVVVNGSVCGRETLLTDGDVVQFFPMAAGG